MAAPSDTEQANILFAEGRYGEVLPRYLELANRGDDRAMLRLGWMYQYGLGVSADAAQARKWYESAVEAGSVDGQYYLGWLHWTRHEFEFARALWTRASESGHLGALYRLGTIYDYGDGVGRDDAKARFYYEQAAARGHVHAQRAVAGKMLRGRYGPSQILAGLYLIVKTVLRGTRTLTRDEFSEQLR